MKRLCSLTICLFLLLSLPKSGFSATDPDSLNKKISALRDSIARQKENEKKIAFYRELYDCYDELGTSLLLNYKDSSRICLDSILALMPKPKKEEDKEDTTRYNFRFKIFTDFVGFRGDQPNGLVQSEVAFAWTINKRTAWFLKYMDTEKRSEQNYETKRLRKKKCDSKGMEWAKTKDELRNKRREYRKGYPNIITPFANLVFPMITLSKVKDSLRYKELNYDTLLKVKHIHTFDLVRYSNFSVCGKLNILTFRTRNRNIKAFIDGFGALYSTGVAERDTLLAADERKHNVNSIGWGWSGKVAFEPLPMHFSLELALANFSLHLLNNDIHQQKGKQYYPASNIKNSAYNNGTAIDAVSIWSASIRYSTKTNKENINNDGMFLRISFYNNITAGLLNAHRTGPLDYNNNFLQVQFGLSKNLNDLLKFLKP